MSVSICGLSWVCATLANSSRNLQTSKGNYLHAFEMCVETRNAMRRQSLLYEDHLSRSELNQPQLVAVRACPSPKVPPTNCHSQMGPVSQPPFHLHFLPPKYPLPLSRTNGQIHVCPRLLCINVTDIIKESNLGWRRVI